jgi:cell division protein FtsB
MNQIQHAMRDQPWRLQRQAVALIALGIFIAIFIGALYLAQSASVSTLGRQLEELIARRNQLEQQNEQLREDISELRSVPRLLARAQELGFTSAAENQIEYLYVAQYNPNREPVLTASAQQTENLPVYDESFVGWVQQQWDNLVMQFQGFSGGSS